MLKTKTITDPAITRKVTESVTCDLCGKEFKLALEMSPGIQWDDEGDAARSYVKFESGYSFYDCAHWKGREYHICPKCFTTKLEPWLQAQGAKSTDTDFSW